MTIMRIEEHREGYGMPEAFLADKTVVDAFKAILNFKDTAFARLAKWLEGNTGRYDTITISHENRDACTHSDRFVCIVTSEKFDREKIHSQTQIKSETFYQADTLEEVLRLAGILT